MLILIVLLRFFHGRRSGLFKIGIQNSPLYTEIKATANGPKTVELGARLGGVCITTLLIPLLTGVNIVECSIRIALGEKPDLEKKWNKEVANRYLQTETGTVKEIIGVEEAEAILGVIQVSIVRGLGEQVREFKCSGDRAGFVIVQAVTARDAILIAEEGLRKMLIERSVGNEGIGI